MFFSAQALVDSEGAQNSTHSQVGGRNGGRRIPSGLDGISRVIDHRAQVGARTAFQAARLLTNVREGR